MDTVEQALERSWLTLIGLILVAVGAADLLIDGVLSKDYERFVETIAWIIGPLALGRGIAARKKD